MSLNKNMKVQVKNLLEKYGELEHLNTKVINRICKILEHMYPNKVINRACKILKNTYPNKVITKHSYIVLEKIDELHLEYENELTHILKKCGINYPNNILKKLFKL
jgi:hypothetical protein